MFQKFIECYEQLLLNLFGFKIVVHLEEFILLLAGIFIGKFIMAIIASNFIYRMEKLERLNDTKFRILRVTKNGKTVYQCNFKTFSEAFHQLCIWFYSPFFTRKKYTLRDEKRTKFFVILMWVIAIIMIVFAILSVCTEFKSPL